MKISANVAKYRSVRGSDKKIRCGSSTRNNRIGLRRMKRQMRRNLRRAMSRATDESGCMVSGTYWS